MGQDTLRETPVAKASEPKIKVGARRVEASRGGFDRAGCSWTRVRAAARMAARLGSTLDSATRSVHTFEAKGPFAFLLAIVVLLAVACDLHAGVRLCGRRGRGARCGRGAVAAALGLRGGEGGPAALGRAAARAGRARSRKP